MCCRDLDLGRRAVQLALELRVRLLDLARLVTDRARDPVDRAELVDDGAADAADRVGLELDGALEVELLDRVHQAEDAVGDEVGLLDVRRQTHADPAGDVLHQRRVVKDQPLAQRLLAGLLELRHSALSAASASAASASASLSSATSAVRRSCLGARVAGVGLGVVGRVVLRRPRRRVGTTCQRRAHARGCAWSYVASQPLDGHMRVDLGRGERSVTEQLLYAT